MNQQRGARDPLAFYDVDLEAQPRATPEAMPRSGWTETFASSFRVVQDDWPSQFEQEVVNDYGPLVEAIQAETGRTTDFYVSVGRGGSSVNERRIFDDLAAIRTRKPDFMRGTPSSIDEFRAATVRRVQERRASDQKVVERGGTTPWVAGGLAAGVTDPFNVMTLPFGGGGGATISRRIISQALTGAVTEAVEQPLIAVERGKRGETLTIGEAAANVGTATVGAGALQGGGELALRGASRLAGPISDLIEGFRTRVGMDRATPAERAAMGDLEREAETASISPFRPGRDTERHLARIDAAERALDNPGSRPPPPAPAFSREAYYRRLRGAESSGDDAARNERSTATGRYQFLDGTWLAYHKRVFGGGLSDAARLAQRSDGSVQEQLMRSLTEDNAATLAKIGERETAGNLYLMHVFGQGGGQAILRAGREAPIEAIVGRRVVEANPFLRGRTVGDTIEWAHGRMGETPDVAPTLRREQFDSDQEWATAQRAVDVEEAALARANDDLAGMVDAAERNWTAIDDTPMVELVDIAPPGGDMARLYRPDIEGGRAYDVEAVARSIAGDAEVVQVEVPRSLIDDALEVQVKAGRARSIDPAAADAWRAAPERLRSTVPADAVDDFVLGSTRPSGPPGYGIEVTPEGDTAYVVWRNDQGQTRAVAAIPLVEEARQNMGGVVTYVGPELRRQGVATNLYKRARAAGFPIDEMTGRADLTPDGAAFAQAWRDRSRTPPAETLARYDDPFDGAAPRTLDETIEHDVRMIAAEAPETLVRMSDEGDAPLLIDVLRDLDEEDAALSAARACLAP